MPRSDVAFSGDINFYFKEFVLHRTRTLRVMGRKLFNSASGGMKRRLFGRYLRFIRKTNLSINFERWVEYQYFRNWRKGYADSEEFERSLKNMMVGIIPEKDLILKDMTDDEYAYLLICHQRVIQTGRLL